MTVLIIGNGMFANIGALHLRRRLPPPVEILLVGPETRGGMPIVGESTIEITARFLEDRLGLGPYLRANHYPKYALTYYFKLDPDDPSDRRYSVHCNERDPENYPPLAEGWQMKSRAGATMARPPSWQLNREVFDRDMRHLVDRTDGIERVYGMVQDVDLDGRTGHTVHVRLAHGGTRAIDADWVVDASGRRMVLGKKLGLKVPSQIQRHAFWFRVSNFDRDLLSNLDALGPAPPGPGEPYHYDRYYSTHHFMGRGNWIWMIPMKSPDHPELMSVGISMRSDLYEGTVRSMEDFLAKVGAAHPVVTDLVRSGRIEDTNLYRNYHYYSKQAYSEDRWAVVGDAAFAPDALFSNGLAFGTIQLDQVGEMIARDVDGDHDPAYIETLDKALWAPLVSSQETIGNWYTAMHDAYLSALRLNWIEVAYFYMLLPLVMNRAHYDPKMMPAWRALQTRQEDVPQASFDLPKHLIAARTLFDKVRPEHFIYRGKVKVNPRAVERMDSAAALRAQMLAGSQIRSAYIADALAQVKIAESLPTDREPAFSM